MSFIDICTEPTILFIQLEQEWVKLEKRNDSSWVHNDITVQVENKSPNLDIYITAQTTTVKRVLFRWKHADLTGIRILGDHWERSYGDAEWRGIVPERILPWYFLTNDGVTTSCYGVKTGPNAMCFWQMSENDITLCMDVRCGSIGVHLSGKSLLMATIIIRKGKENETPFSVARAFCKTLCDKPVVPSFPVYGGNNWYYCYGISNQTQILEDAKRVADWASGDNRPFMLVDGGWQEINIKDYAYCGGPWIKGNSGFPDMEALAQSIKDLNVKPGLWFRPLTTIENMPAEWKLPSNRFKIEYEGEILDPSVPEVLEHIEKDVRRFLDWGYELIKHDFSTWDIFGRWGFDMKEQITNDGWSFADTSKTSAQIIKGFYQAIYKQGKDALIIGCNTISHLAAGLVHIQRTGDDTSGLDWERTRKMGVNTLAFRMQQHETFYYSDCDCVGLTNKIPWELNKQWMELLSESGTPFFVSASPDMLGEDQNKAIRKAFDVASKYQHPAEPLDWMDNTCPSKWNIDGKVVKYTWDDLNRKCFDLG